MLITEDIHSEYKIINDPTETQLAVYAQKILSGEIEQQGFGGLVKAWTPPQGVGFSQDAAGLWIMTKEVPKIDWSQATRIVE